MPGSLLSQATLTPPRPQGSASTRPSTTDANDCAHAVALVTPPSLSQPPPLVWSCPLFGPALSHCLVLPSHALTDAPTNQHRGDLRWRVRCQGEAHLEEEHGRLHRPHRHRQGAGYPGLKRPAARQARGRHATSDDGHEEDPPTVHDPRVRDAASPQPDRQQAQDGGNRPGVAEAQGRQQEACEARRPGVHPCDRPRPSSPPDDCPR